MKSGLFARAFGLRLALWYATLFIIGSIAIVSFTYVLTSVSLAQGTARCAYGTLDPVSLRQPLTPARVWLGNDPRPD